MQTSLLTGVPEANLKQQVSIKCSIVVLIFLLQMNYRTLQRKSISISISVSEVGDLCRPVFLITVSLFFCFFRPAFSAGL